LAITSPLWFPLMALAVTIAAPIAGVIAVKDIVQDKRQLKHYLCDKKGAADLIAKEVLEGFTEDAIFKRLESSFLDVFNRYLKQFCEHSIPQQIAADEQLVKHIQDDMRDSEEIRLYYRPLELKGKCIAGKVLYIMMEYFNCQMIPPENIVKGDVIGTGAFAHVYKATVKYEGHRNEAVAVKCFITPLEYSEYYSQWSEVETLM